MCARFELIMMADLVRERFDLRVPPDEDPAHDALACLPLVEVRPTDRAVVIGPRRIPVPLAWGLAVDWDKRPLIHARAETLAEKPVFRRLLGNRCLVPATAFFEWSGASAASGTRRAKRRHRIARGDGAAQAMAGLVDPESGRFTIITRAANDQIAPLHPRMPVLLNPDDESAWLDPARPFAAVRPLLAGWRGPLSIDPPSGSDNLL